MIHEDHSFPDMRRLFLALTPTLGDLLEEAIKKRQKEAAHVGEAVVFMYHSNQL